MSKIQDFGVGYEKLPNILNKLRDDLDEVESVLVIKDKTVEAANRENPTWQYFYASRKVEVGTLVKYFEAEIASVRGMLFRKFKETHNMELSEREIQRYIDNEEKYLTIHEIYLEVKEVYEMYVAAVDAFTTRGYALNNITKARVAECNGDVIE